MAYHSDRGVFRDTVEGKVAGVCAGLSEYFKIDVTLIRVLTAFLIIAWGSGLILYLILWAVLPEKQYY